MHLNSRALRKKLKYNMKKNFLIFGQLPEWEQSLIAGAIIVAIILILFFAGKRLLKNATPQHEEGTLAPKLSKYDKFMKDVWSKERLDEYYKRRELEDLGLYDTKY